MSIALTCSVVARHPWVTDHWLVHLARGPVTPDFPLPDRFFFFQFIDQPSTGGEGFGAVRRAERDDHRGLSHRNSADAVDDRELGDRPLRSDGGN